MTPPKLPPPPAPKSKGPPGETKAVALMLKAHPNLQSLLPMARDAAAQWDVPVMFLLAVLAREGGTNGQTNSAGARGVAQVADKAWLASLNPTRAAEFKRLFGAQVASPAAFQHATLTDPRFAIQYMAWRLSDDYHTVGADKAYVQGYNPKYTQVTGDTTPITSLLPKNYVLPATAQSPVASAATSQTRRDAAKLFQAQEDRKKDPWVLVDKKGNITGFSTNATAPKNALQTMTSQGMQPVTKQGLIAAKHSQIDDIFYPYLGRNATPSEAAKVLKYGWSADTIHRQLAQNPRFYNSPLWRSAAPGLVEEARQIYGQQFTPDRKLVRQAIIESWQPAVWQAKLRNLPSYTKSAEFKQDQGNMQTAFEQIYGTPNAQDLRMIQEATLARWTPDQFQRHLRSLPQWANSPDAQRQQQDGLVRLSQLTGRNFAYTAGQQTGSMYAPDKTTIPNDPRVKGNPQTVTTPEQGVNPEIL